MEVIYNSLFPIVTMRVFLVQSSCVVYISFQVVFKWMMIVYSLCCSVNCIVSCRYVLPTDAKSLWDIFDKYSVKVVKAGNLNIQKDITVSSLLVPCNVLLVPCNVTLETSFLSQHACLYSSIYISMFLLYVIHCVAYCHRRTERLG